MVRHRSLEPTFDGSNPSSPATWHLGIPTDAPSRSGIIQSMTSETPDPVIEAYKEGIDRTLLRENLRLTPEERVRNLQRLQRLADAAREAGIAQRKKR